MKHQAKNFDHLVGQLEGISENQLKAHFGLYQGYVNKLNEIEQKLGHADRSAGNYSYNEYSELKRREAVAFNGSYLHQLYFENLGQPGQNVDANFKAGITEAFGSWDTWVADVRAAATSTPGWVLTTYNKIDHKLHNYVIYEHHLHLPVHQEIVMALDCWEHAYMVDYSTQKAKYLDAFMNNINWQSVGKRFTSYVK